MSRDHLQPTEDSTPEQVPEGGCNHAGRHTRAVHEELQPMGRIHAGKVGRDLMLQQGKNVRRQEQQRQG